MQWGLPSFIGPLVRLKNFTVFFFNYGFPLLHLHRLKWQEDRNQTPERFVAAISAENIRFLLSNARFPRLDWKRRDVHGYNDYCNDK